MHPNCTATSSDVLNGTRLELIFGSVFERQPDYSGRHPVIRCVSRLPVKFSAFQERPTMRKERQRERAQRDWTRGGCLGTRPVGRWCGCDVGITGTGKKNRSGSETGHSDLKSKNGWVLVRFVFVGDRRLFSARILSLTLFQLFRGGCPDF